MPWLVTEGSSLPSVFVAAVFIFLSLAIGRRLLILLGARGPATLVERGLIAVGLGAGALQFVPFALGALGFLTTTSLHVVTALLLLAVGPDLWAVSVAGIAAFRRRTRPDSWTIAWIIALSPALLLAALVALAPTLDPDGLAYHLTVPKRWMQTGRLDYLPGYPYSNAPMGMEMLFALGMAFSGDVAAKCFHYALGLVAATTIYYTGLRLAGRMAGAVPATLFLVGPVGAAGLLGFAYVEGAAALAIAGSLLSWVVWYQTGRCGYLRSAALLAGFAVSFKISVGLFPAALLAFTAIVVGLRKRDQHNSTTRGSAAYSGMIAAARLLPLTAAPMLPWFTRAFITTGNPLFPLFATVIPTSEFSADLARKIDQYNRYTTWGNTIGSDLTLQERFWVLVCVAVVMALVAGLAFLKLRGPVARGAVGVLIFASLVQLSAAGLYIRYWLPLLPALLVPIASVLAPVLSRRAMMAAWIGVTLMGSLWSARGVTDLPSLVRTVAGIEGRTEFLRARIVPYPLYELANRELPANALIMLSGYCGGFYLDRRTFCADYVQNSMPFTTWQQFTDDLQRLGITHLIAPNMLASHGPVQLPKESSIAVINRPDHFRLVNQLLTSHARTVATAGDLGLYEIDPTLLHAR